MVTYKSSKSLLDFDLDLMWIAALIQAELLRILIASLMAPASLLSSSPEWITTECIGAMAILFPVIGITLYRAGRNTVWGRVLLAAHYLFGACATLGILWGVDGDRVLPAALRLGVLLLGSLFIRVRAWKSGEAVLEEPKDGEGAFPYEHYGVSCALGFSYLILGVSLIRMLSVVATGTSPLSPIGPDWVLQGMILGEVVLFAVVAVLGYRGGKHEFWARCMHGTNLVIAVTAVGFFVETLKVQSDAVFLALWPVLFVLLAYGSKANPRVTAIKADCATDTP